MSHTSDIESRPNPEGLQEIRSWASRSPDSARPGFRMRQPGGLRRTPRFAATALLSAIALLFSLAGFRFFQTGQDTPDLAATPVEEASPPAEVMVDSPPPPQKTVPAQVTRPERPEPEEHQTVVRPKPAAKEPRASSRSEVVVSRDVFESEPAVLLSTPAAEYPEVARGTGTSAKIIVGFTIDETGAVRNPVIESIRIQGDAPKAPFEQAALAAARSARFTPAQESGVPTRSWSTLTFSFETGPATAGI